MILICFLIFLLGVGSYFYLDKMLLQTILTHNLEIKFAWVKYVTIFGEGAIYLAILPVFWFINRNKKLLAEKIIYAFFVLGSSNVVALILKISLGRARPNMYILDGIYGLHSITLDSDFWSLPSGHAITMFALFLISSVVFSAWRNFFGIFTILIIISRLILLKHYLSDILFAILIDCMIFYTINIFIYNQKYLPSLLKYIESNPKLLARFLFSK
jgi:membrane-associated phospholipid phosphatase